VNSEEGDRAVTSKGDRRKARMLLTMKGSPTGTSKRDQKKQNLDEKKEEGLRAVVVARAGAYQKRRAVGEREGRYGVLNGKTHRSLSKTSLKSGYKRGRQPVESPRGSANTGAAKL